MTSFIAVAVAAAAIFAAIAAWLSFLTQRRSVWSSVRPDVEIEDIAYANLGQSAEVQIGKLVNYGLGPARLIQAKVYGTHVTEAFVSGPPIATLRPGHDIGVNWVVRVPWRPEKIATSFRLSVYCFDLFSNKHEARYVLMAREGGRVDGLQELCPHLYVYYRKVFISTHLKQRMMQICRSTIAVKDRFGRRRKP